MLSEADADKWIVFIFFMMGLSIGVHLIKSINHSGHCDGVLFPQTRSVSIMHSFASGLCASLVLGVYLAFIGGLVVANAEVNPERGVEMDSTLGGLMLAWYHCCHWFTYITSNL
jgi:hypothetical protein